MSRQNAEVGQTVTAPRTSTSHQHPARSTPHRALLLGYGRIGQAVAAVAFRERDRLRAAGVELQPVRALVRDVNKPRSGPVIPLVTHDQSLFGDDLDVVVEALGGVEPARTLVTRALRAGLPVVSANKSLVAAHGPELRALAARYATTFACDGAVLAGVPFLGSLARRPLVAAARRIEGILNGTSHVIVTALAQGASFVDALADALEHGYAEPDSAADVSGRDAAEKLTVLLHLAGCEDVRVDDLPVLGLEMLETGDLAAATRLGGAIKPIVLASLDPDAAGAWVGPAFVAEEHPFARLTGVTNALRLFTAAGTCTFSGPGAGPDVTAHTIVDDVVEAVTGGPAWPVGDARARVDVTREALRQPPPASWFLRIASGSDIDRADVAELLASHRVPALRIDGHSGHVTALTAPASWPEAREVVEILRASCARVLTVPALAGGAGE
ncbi:MAG: homoserine dehydrogenase [Vicinamibacterales bacterium]